jgi:excisionase family DNA binding protein
MLNKKITPQTFRIANPPHQPFRIPPPPKPVVQLQPLAVGSYQASEMLSISTGFLRKLTKEGKIPHKKLGAKIVYRVEELKKFLAKTEEVKIEETKPEE